MKKLLSLLVLIIVLLSIYRYSVQAFPNIYLEDIIQNNNTTTKSKIMSNYEKNKDKKNFKEGEILLKVKIGTSILSMQSTEKKYSIKSKKNLNHQLGIVEFDNNKYSMDEMLLNLNNDFNIEYAEPNYISRLFNLPENEPGFSKMWGLKNTISQGIDVNVMTAWNISTGNPNIVVGVIDTGIDYNHEDLKENVWFNKGEIQYNGIDDDNNGYIDDYSGWNFAYRNNNYYDDQGHGTHVSGTIAALSNGKGIVGIAPNVKIMPLKVADAQGDLYVSDVVSAIQYGRSKGVKLFNCSFGSAYFSQTQYEIMKSSNALFMCASGNGDYNNKGLDNDSYVKVYPSSYDLPNIISVASIDKYGSLSTFSNYGMVSVDIAAPGSEILSTLPGGYGYSNGTSMATPHVTGVAALVLSANLDLSPIQVKEIILKSAMGLPQLVNKVVTGAIVNAFGAVNIAKLITTTDIDGNGTTDIVDLVLVGLAYSSRIGDEKYKSKLDINNDSIIDIYDLALVSKVLNK